MYRVPDNEVYDISDFEWFVRSYDVIEMFNINPLDGTLTPRSVEEADREYEHIYGVKIIYGDSTSDEKVKNIRCLEFTDKESATEFILRWF